MAKQRFRDIKQGKKEAKSEKKQELTPIISSHYATSRLKIKAFLTDAFMLVMPIMYIVFYFIMEGREEFAQDKILGWMYILMPLVIIQTLFMYKTGQTPGYRNYRITLIDENTQQKPSILIILFRNLLAILSLFSVIGWILMFFRKDHKTLHDLLSATAVIIDDSKR
ncbi:MAG: RDD family protein [Sulfurovum sp.]|nr:RDD family protein [Sulfurovum sp.]